VRRQRFVIAGGGIGGLTTAIVLARAGHKVELLEQAPVLAASVGAGVTLAPNAMKVYGHMGLEAALCARGVEPRRQRVQHWRDGRSLVEMDRGDRVRELYGAPYLYIHRGDLHAVLIEALEATGRATLRLGAAVVGARADEAGAAAVLSSGEDVAGDIVIAATSCGAPSRRSRGRSLPSSPTSRVSTSGPAG
jgi:salicylate hydroxylase